MLEPWLELPGVAEQVAGFSAATGLDLVRLGTTADADEIKDTAVTQPLIVALGVIVANQLGLVTADERVVAGHSIGELTAAAVSGALTPTDAVAFAARRGAEMAAACALTPTGMSALLGGDPDEVAAGIEAAGLTPANRNGAGQIVAAGAQDALDKLAAEPPAGARVRPLAVAGAFHTHYMAPAAAALTSYADGLAFADPRPILLSNADGSSVDSGAELQARLVRQVTLPVRWDLCLRTCADLGVTAALELAPAGTLTGIAKRALPGVETFALKTPDQLDDARAFCVKHGEASVIDTTPTWLMVVSPSKGTFHRSEEAGAATVLEPGAALGDVASSRDRTAVRAPHGGQVVEWLVEDGDLVSPGQPLVRLHPVGAA
jgi:[acyl-carrier-protein] S-malonyltransferase